MKPEDFRFAIRKDELAIGRVKELITTEKMLKDARKQFDTSEGKAGLERGGRKRKGEELEDTEMSGAVRPKMTMEDIGEDDLDD